MEEIIRKFRIDGVWHFTDKSNISSIKLNGGLLSLGELERRGIEIAAPGGNKWSHDADKLKGLHEYVHLAFIADHPMLFRAKEDERVKDPVWLKIKPEILLCDRVHYTTDVSNKSGVEILTSREARERIDFEVLFAYMNWRDPDIQARRQAAIKSEILIPDKIPVDMILGIYNG